ncbi:MAG: aldo/keto reductase [Pseudomonadota bacterium]
MSIYFTRGMERGFGTFPLTGDAVHQAIQTAAEVGFRAFDTAQMYGNEQDTGAALKATGLDRDALCITTKVDPVNFAADRFLPSVEQSLRNLQVDAVDVLLLHWPPADFKNAESLDRLAEAKHRGHTRHIGISNYTAAMMRDAVTQLGSGEICTNQVEFHPLLNQDTLLAAAAETGIALSAYCAVARGKVFEEATIQAIAAAHGKSAAQVALRWILQKGVATNAMSTKPANIAANFDTVDFTLSSVDMARIDALTATNYRIVNKDLVPTAPDFD